MKPELRKYMRNRNAESKKKAFDKLGNKCARCGFSDIRALQIDHVYGDGYLYKYERANCYTIYELVIADIWGRYQCLCANCNWIKKAENCENKPRID
jgi:hypothetical protein